MPTPSLTKGLTIKDETMTTQANEAAAVLSAFKRDANATLKQKTDELVALSGVATDTKAAKDCAETELRRLRQAIAQHEANVSRCLEVIAAGGGDTSAASQASATRR